MKRYIIPENLKISLAAARVNAMRHKQDVADKIGVSRSTVYSWESGKTSPSIHQAIRLYEIYDRPVDSIRFAVH